MAASSHLPGTSDPPEPACSEPPPSPVVVAAPLGAMDLLRPLLVPARTVTDRWPTHVAEVTLHLVLAALAVTVLLHGRGPGRRGSVGP